MAAYHPKFGIRKKPRTREEIARADAKAERELGRKDEAAKINRAFREKRAATARSVSADTAKDKRAYAASRAEGSASRGSDAVTRAMRTGTTGKDGKKRAYTQAELASIRREATGGGGGTATGATTGRATPQRRITQGEHRQRQQSYEKSRRDRRAKLRTGVRRVPAAPLTMGSPEDRQKIQAILAQAGQDTLPELPQFDTKSDRALRNALLTAQRGASSRGVVSSIAKDTSAQEQQMLANIRALRTPQQQLQAQLDPEYDKQLTEIETRQTALSGRTGRGPDVGGIAGSTSGALGQQAATLQAQQGAAASAGALLTDSTAGELDRINRIPTIGSGIPGAAPAAQPETVPLLPGGTGTPLVDSTMLPMPVTERSQGRGSDQALFDAFRKQQTGAPLAAAAPPNDRVVRTAPTPPPTFGPSTAPAASAPSFQFPGGATPPGLTPIGAIPNQNAPAPQVGPVDVPVGSMSGVTSEASIIAGGAQNIPGSILDVTAPNPDAVRALRAMPTATGATQPVTQPIQPVQPSQAEVSGLLARLQAQTPTSTPKEVAAQALRLGAPQALVETGAQGIAARALRPSSFPDVPVAPAGQPAGGGFAITAPSGKEAAEIATAKANAAILQQTGTLTGLNITEEQRKANIIANAPIAGEIGQMVRNVRDIIAPRGKISSAISLGGPDEVAASNLAASIASRMQALTTEQRAGVTGSFGQPDDETIRFIRDSLAAFAQAPGFEFGQGQQRMRDALTQILSLLTNPNFVPAPPPAPPARTTPTLPTGVNATPDIIF